jgi:phosphoserine phosphatase
MVSKGHESVNEFSSALWSDLDTAIAAAVQRSKANNIRPVAAFDADGTLWDRDAGEAFFQWQLDNCRFQGLPGDPWAHYRNWKKRDPHGAYGWLAQISSGSPLNTVRTWAESCYQSHQPWPVFRSIKMLFEKLHAAGFEIFVVTASVKWAVEPGALHLLGVANDHVLGIETEAAAATPGGPLIISDRVISPVTYRQGKADALLRATGGRKPLIAAGNTIGDIALLESATDLKLMIQSQSPLASEDAELAASEKKLRDHGRPLGWRLHAFRS